jgi:hypothetical protein
MQGHWSSFSPSAETEDTGTRRIRNIECGPRADCGVARAFSSEVDTGSREENASKQQSGASLLIQSEAKKL